MTTIVEVRCPVGPRKLLSKLQLGEESGRYVGGTLIEFTCSDCARTVLRQEGNSVRVFHRFNFVGQLVSTSIEARH